MVSNPQRQYGQTSMFLNTALFNLIFGILERALIRINKVYLVQVNPAIFIKNSAASAAYETPISRDLAVSQFPILCFSAVFKCF